jgi:1,4-dihydroxy-2-naphthoyl-CoA synthase
MGKRLASEILFLEKILTAKEALNCGFINGIINLPKGDFFDYNEIPCIPKLLKNDLKTMVNCKRLITMGLSKEVLHECSRRET